MGDGHARDSQEEPVGGAEQLRICVDGGPGGRPDPPVRVFDGRVDAGRGRGVRHEGSWSSADRGSEGGRADDVPDRGLARGLGELAVGTAEVVLRREGREAAGGGVRLLGDPSRGHAFEDIRWCEQWSASAARAARHDPRAAGEAGGLGDGLAHDRGPVQPDWEVRGVGQCAAVGGDRVRRGGRRDVPRFEGLREEPRAHGVGLVVEQLGVRARGHGLHERGEPPARERRARAGVAGEHAEVRAHGGRA